MAAIQNQKQPICVTFSFQEGSHALQHKLKGDAVRHKSASQVSRIKSSYFGWHVCEGLAFACVAAHASLLVDYDAKLGTLSFTL